MSLSFTLCIFNSIENVLCFLVVNAFGLQNVCSMAPSCNLEILYPVYRLSKALLIKCPRYAHCDTIARNN